VEAITTKLGPITNPNMKSDLTTASALADAAITGALANVDINLGSIKDQAFIQQTRIQVSAVKAQ
jgi:formiminotetrahydrofolate cyclodeaminase